MRVVNFGNYRELLYDGARIAYGNSVAVVVADTRWNGGYRVNGCSIRNVLEEHALVQLL
jgi:hypothetical protein